VSSIGTSTPTYRAPALEKGIDVLEYLAAADAPRTQAQIARDLERQPTELFRTLTILERRGYLDRDSASGAYSLTLRLFELGHAHSPYDVLLRVCDAPMRQLATDLGCSVHLSVLRGSDVLVLHQAESGARVRVSVAIGSTVPAVQSAAGRLLLAALDEQVLAALPGLPADGEFRSHLTAVRASGFESARGEIMEGLTDLAVPLGGAGLHTRAALTATALARDHQQFVHDALAPLQECSNHITRAAGLRPFTREI
jgi:DNA-binding IclR family transcriptional regulator